MITDRRRQPTPILSRFTLGGRRKGFYGERPFPKERYVDRYSPALLFFLILITGLNFLDSCLTMMILERGGRELNPIVESAIRLLGPDFWIWKFLIVSVSLTILCLHSQFAGVKLAIFSLCFLYVGLVCYQLVGLIFFTL